MYVSLIVLVLSRLGLLTGEVMHLILSIGLGCFNFAVFLQCVFQLTYLH